MKDLMYRIRERSLTRRDFNKMLGALGFAVVGQPLFARTTKAAENDIFYYTWEGYNDPILHPKYVEKYGASPEMGVFASEEEGFQKLLAGFEATFYHPCSYMLPRLKAANAIQPFDTSRLSNWENLFEGLRNVPGANDGGTQWYIPFDWGNSSITYRSDLSEFAEESWTMLYDERYKGRLGTTDDGQANVEIAGLIHGAKNIFNQTDEELAKTRELLTKQRELLRFYWTSETEAQQALASGEVVASYTWNAAYSLLSAEGIPVKFAKPKEGIFTWVCGLVRVNPMKGSEEAAYDFVDAMLDPEVGKYLLETWGYGHSNKIAYEIADPNVIANLGMKDPAEVFTSGVFFEPVEQEVVDKYENLYQEVKAGF